METIKLYYSGMNQNYFSADRYTCVRCRQDIEKVMVYCSIWYKRQFVGETYCHRCFHKIKHKGIVDEQRIVLLVDFVPEDAIPVFVQPPVLAQSKNLSVFEAADRQLDQESIIDNTVLAGRSEGSWTGLKIGSPDMGLLKAKDKQLSAKEGLRLLEAMKDE